MLRWLGLAALVLGAFVWGLAAGTYKLFPFAELQALQDMATPGGMRGAGEYRDNAPATARGLEMADWTTQAEIVMIGDSITEFAPWKDMFPQVDILNRGASGDTVSGVDARLDAILGAAPEHAFILIGTNDLNLENPVAGVLEIYERVAERLGEAGVRITLQTIPPCETSFDFCTARRREAEAALNKGITALARRQNANLVDLAVAFPRGRQYRADGVHPTVKGYKAWRDVLEQYVVSEAAREQSK